MRHLHVNASACESNARATQSLQVCVTGTRFTCQARDGKKKRANNADLYTLTIRLFSFQYGVLAKHQLGDVRMTKHIIRARHSYSRGPSTQIFCLIFYPTMANDDSQINQYDRKRMNAILKESMISISNLKSTFYFLLVALYILLPPAAAAFCWFLFFAFRISV